MAKYSIEGSKPVNIIIEASNEKGALLLAKEGEGYIEECIGSDVEIKDKPSIVKLHN